MRVIKQGAMIKKQTIDTTKFELGDSTAIGSELDIGIGDVVAEVELFPA
jgi:hypothetical protein